MQDQRFKLKKKKSKNLRVSVAKAEAKGESCKKINEVTYLVAQNAKRIPQTAIHCFCCLRQRGCFKLASNFTEYIQFPV